MDIQSLSTILSFILIIGGVIAILLPFAPSIPMVWFGIFIYAISHDFLDINQQFMVIVSVIAATTIILDYTLSRSGVYKLKVGPWGVLGAVAGGLVGSLFSPIMAYIVGPVVGAIVMELLRGHDQVFSFKSGNYTIVAFMGGTIVKLAAAIVMVGMFFLRLQGKI
jgi:uncharacterized protein YqgC (DUF456 family)